MSYCAKCGAKLEPDSVYCPSCGTPVTTSTRLPPSVPTSIQRVSRPSGVTILTILEGITSLFMLVGGVGLLVLSTFLASGGWNIIPEAEFAEALEQVPWASTFTDVQIFAFTAAFLTGIGLVLLILAVLGFIMTWGLWTGKSWARTITMILAVIGIVTGIFSLPGSLISILIDIVILYYLRQPEIQAYFQAY